MGGRSGVVGLCLRGAIMQKEGGRRPRDPSPPSSPVCPAPPFCTPSGPVSMGLRGPAQPCL